MPVRVVKGALLALVLLAGWLTLAEYRSAERGIRRQLTRLQRLVAKAPTESELSSLSQARKIAGFFAEPLHVTAESESLEISDRRSLIGSIHQYRSRSSVLVMQLEGEEIFVDERGQGANVFLLARFLAGLGDLTDSEPERYRMRLHLSLQDGRWLIDSAIVDRLAD